MEFMMPALANVNLIGPPGKIYSYQNLAYSLIQPIVESLTESDYESVLRERLFTPMNMKNASASYAGITRDSDVAFPHYYYRGNLRRGRITEKYYNAIPSGGINASIWDMANFMISITGHKPWVIDPATLEQLYKPVVPTYIKYKYFGGWPKMRKSYYGMGFRILEYDNKRVVYHGGYVNGYRTGMAILPDDNIGICILTNYSGSLANRGIRDFIDMYITYEDYINDFNDIPLVELLKPTPIPERRQHHSVPPL